MYYIRFICFTKKKEKKNNPTVLPKVTTKFSFK